MLKLILRPLTGLATTWVIALVSLSVMAHSPHAYAGISAAQSVDLRSAEFTSTILSAHNAERSRQHVPLLRWSPRLAADAQVWANRLALRNELVHATFEERANKGENLWWNRVGVSGPKDAVAAFTAERRYFRAGVFPNISATNRWQDVGHYSQVIWRETQELGCATARNAVNDFWVCRYWPAGNVLGARVP